MLNNISFFSLSQPCISHLQQRFVHRIASSHFTSKDTLSKECRWVLKGNLLVHQTCCLPQGDKPRILVSPTCWLLITKCQVLLLAVIESIFQGICKELIIHVKDSETLLHFYGSISTSLEAQAPFLCSDWQSSLFCVKWYLLGVKLLSSSHSQLIFSCLCQIFQQASQTFFWESLPWARTVKQDSGLGQCLLVSFELQFLYGEYLGYGSASKKESHMLFLHHKEGNS